MPRGESLAAYIPAAEAGKIQAAHQAAGLIHKTSVRLSRDRILSWRADADTSCVKLPGLHAIVAAPTPRRNCHGFPSGHVEGDRQP